MCEQRVSNGMWCWYIRGLFMRAGKVCAFFLGILLGGSTFCMAKSAPDSIGVDASTFAAVGTNATPLWLRANQQGLISAQPLNAGLMMRAAAHHKMGKHHIISFRFSPVIYSGQKFFNTNTYAEYGFGAFRVTAGAKHLNNDLENDSLASGGFGLSRNARPIPGVQLGIYKYAPIPFTAKWVSVRGWLKHGLLWDDRFTKKPMLHEKHLGLKIGPAKFHGTVNLYHYAIWNGVHPEKGQFPERWEDYWRVFRGKNADHSYWRSWRIRNEFNALGSHIGVGNVGLRALIGKHSFAASFEKIAEDKGGVLIPENNKDFKLTLSWKHERENVNLQALVEIMRTDWQSGPGIPDSNDRHTTNYGYEYGGRDDYYNNGNYKSGWTYHGAILGNPLFLTDDDAREAMDIDINDYGRFIVNNRLRALHIGFSVRIPKRRVGFKVRSTLSRNYGTYTGLNGGRYEWGSMDDNWSDDSYPFNNVLNQSCNSLEIQYGIKRSQVRAMVGIDLGEMYNTAGFLVQYTFRIR